MIRPYFPAPGGEGQVPVSVSEPTQSSDVTPMCVRLKNATDPIYTPQVSADLSTWQAGSPYITQISATDLDAARQQVVVRSNAPPSGRGAGFSAQAVAAGRSATK